MFGVLDRYIGKTIFASIMMTLFTLVSLSAVIKFVDQLRKVGQGQYSTFSAGIYTLLTAPADITVFFPMAALLGALLGLGTLATRSELVVMQAAGFSRLQVAGAVMKTAIPLVLLTMLIGEYISPASQQFAKRYQIQKIDGTSLVSTQSGFWAKDGDDFIYIQQFINEKHLLGVSIYHFNAQHRLASIRYAADAYYDEQQKLWQLTQVDQSDLTNQQQIGGTQLLTSQWKSDLTPDKLGVVALDPDTLSIRGLYHYIRYLQQTGQESSRYQLNIWSKIFSPLSVAVMMLMALSFIFGPLRSVTMGVKVVIGIACGFFFYVLNQIFGPLSLVYHFPPMLGALLPSLLFLAVSVYLLMKRR